MPHPAHGKYLKMNPGIWVNAIFLAVSREAEDSPCAMPMGLKVATHPLHGTPSARQIGCIGSWESVLFFYAETQKEERNTGTNPSLLVFPALCSPLTSVHKWDGWNQ